MDTGKSSNTLGVYISAISAFHSGIKNIPVGRLPSGAQFMAGAKRLRPQPVTLPNWSLQPVLEALSKAPWEPIISADLKHVTLKTVFVLAITSARRVSELQALCLDNGCYKTVGPDTVILRTNVNFQPKCRTLFHRAQEIKLESFHPNPSTD